MAPGARLTERRGERNRGPRRAARPRKDALRPRLRAAGRRRRTDTKSLRLPVEPPAALPPPQRQAGAAASRRPPPVRRPEKERREKAADPNSPFAKLAALKEQLEADKERR